MRLSSASQQPRFKVQAAVPRPPESPPRRLWARSGSSIQLSPSASHHAAGGRASNPPKRSRDRCTCGVCRHRAPVHLPRSQGPASHQQHRVDAAVVFCTRGSGMGRHQGSGYPAAARRAVHAGAHIPTKSSRVPPITTPRTWVVGDLRVLAPHHLAARCDQPQLAHVHLHKRHAAQVGRGARHEVGRQRAGI